MARKTPEEIDAEQNAAHEEHERRRAEWALKKEADHKYEAAWCRFVAVCYLNRPNAEAGRAAVELAHLIVERGRVKRLEEVAAAFSDRRNESRVAAALLEATAGKVSPTKLGNSLNAARTWADGGALSDAADTLKEAVAADAFSPPPKPEQPKPAQGKPQAATLAPKGKAPMLTEPLTKKQLGEYFTCHRNNVQQVVLEKFPHETIGKKRKKYQMHAANMPAAYHAKHKAQ